MFGPLTRILRSDDKTALGVVSVLLLVLVVLAVDTGFVTRLFAPGGQTVRAHFADTGGLKKGDKVRVKGIDVGLVDDISLDGDGRSATVEMTIRKEGQPIRSDARAFIRWRTVLGGSFAVDLSPGSAGSPELGSADIPVAQTQNQIEVDDVVSFVKDAVKDGLRITLDEVPQALNDRDAAAGALSAVNGAAPDLTKTLSAIRGRDERDLRPLISATGRTMKALTSPPGALRQLLEGATATVRVTAARQDELRRTLELGGGIQPRVRATLAALDGTLAKADPLIDHLQAPAQDLAPTLVKLRPTVVGADRLLTDARPVVRSLRPAVTALASAARTGQPLLHELAPSVSRLTRTILPDLAVKDPVTKLRTFEIIGPTIASLNGSGATFDAGGHLFRFPAIGGENALSDILPCSVGLTNPEAPSSSTCSSLSDSFKSVLSFLNKPIGAKP